MTKSEKRKARKEAREQGLPLTGELALSENDHRQSMDFSESHRGQVARYRWARRYDELNGAPEGDWDR